MSARMDGQEGCFSSMGHPAQDVIPAGTSSCRICRRTTFPRWMKQERWSRWGALIWWRASTETHRMSCPSSSVPCSIPKDGCEFIVADFSAIEARVLAWEAGEQWVLDAFQNEEDLYCATASQMFHVPVVKHGVNGELRQKGKIATLACGYGGSSGALISMGALQMGLKEDELPEIIDSWREANPQIVKYWWDTEKAAMTAFKTGERQEIGKIAFEFYSGTLWMVLPSGRRLAYLKPRQQPNRFGRMSLTYEGVGQNHKWSRQETYSGRLVENATQAIARDILAEAMDRISAHGLNIVAHVHDEVIIEAPKDQYTVEEICKLMSENPAWCKGLPLAAAGYKGNYYFKD